MGPTTKRKSHSQSTNALKPGKHDSGVFADAQVRKEKEKRHKYHWLKHGNTGNKSKNEREMNGVTPGREGLILGVS